MPVLPEESIRILSVRPLELVREVLNMSEVGNTFVEIVPSTKPFIEAPIVVPDPGVLLELPAKAIPGRTSPVETAPPPPEFVPIPIILKHFFDVPQAVTLA